MNDAKRGQPRSFVPRRRQWAALLFAVTVMAIMSQPGAAKATGGRDSPKLKARAAILLDVITGRVLWSLEPDRPSESFAAQLIMTALVAMEEVAAPGSSPGAKVITVGRKTAGSGDSLRLTPGEKLTVRDLVSGVLLVGSRDAVRHLAEGVSGSEAAFLRRLNEKARELGARATRFISLDGPGGLEGPDGRARPGGSTTARDLALIARAALLDADLAELVGARTRVIPWAGSPADRKLINSNGLSRRYAGADGVLAEGTGSRRTLVASATRGRWQLLAVVLGSGDPEADAARLLDFGFAHYIPEEVIPEGQIVKTIKVRGGSRERVGGVTSRPLVVPLAPGELPKLQRIDAVPTSVRAPVSAGDRIGEVRLLIDGEVVARVAVLAASSVMAEPMPHALSPWSRLVNLWFRMIHYGTSFHRGGPRPRDSVHSDGA